MYNNNNKMALCTIGYSKYIHTFILWNKRGKNDFLTLVVLYNYYLKQTRKQNGF